MTPFLPLILLAGLGQCDNGNCPLPILGAPARAAAEFVQSNPARRAFGAVADRARERPLVRGFRPVKGVRKRSATRRQARAMRRR